MKSGCLLKYMRCRIEKKECGKVSKTQEFDFYYGIEAEQYSFYRVPRLLIKDDRFKPLSSDAKLLYGLMLDRMSLSMKNGWLDDENRVYIIYTIDNILEDLGCARATCTKILKELDGIGLIEKKRRGLGKPDIIYVKNFATIDEEKEPKMSDNADKSTEVQNLNFKKFKNYTSGNSENELQEVQNLGIQKSKKQTSGSSEIELAEVQKLNPNYNNNNYTDLNYINPINQSMQKEPCKEPDWDGIDMMDHTDNYRKIIKKNIEYEKHMSDSWEYVDADKPDPRLFEELYELICEIVCVKQQSIKINGVDYPYELVKSRFLNLNSSHLEYVMESLQKTSTKIANIRAYLLTALFNAPATMMNSIEQEVRHDMFGGGWEEKGIL